MWNDLKPVVVDISIVTDPFVDMFKRKVNTIYILGQKETQEALKAA